MCHSCHQAIVTRRSPCNFRRLHKGIHKASRSPHPIARTAPVPLIIAVPRLRHPSLPIEFVRPSLLHQALTLEFETVQLGVPLQWRWSRPEVGDTAPPTPRRASATCRSGAPALGEAVWSEGAAWTEEAWMLHLNRDLLFSQVCGRSRSALVDTGVIGMPAGRFVV